MCPTDGGPLSSQEFFDFVAHAQSLERMRFAIRRDLHRMRRKNCRTYPASAVFFVKGQHSIHPDTAYAMEKSGIVDAAVKVPDFAGLVVPS